MNKHCLFFGLVLLCLAFLFSLVNAEIVGFKTERFDLGNGRHKVVLHSGTPFMRNEFGEWTDFNKVARLVFRNREIFIEWKNKVIELNPSVYYNGNKYYTQQIPDSLWSKIDWQKFKSSFRGALKFAVKLKRVNGIQAVAFDVNSSEPMTYSLDENWVSFGGLYISFQDLVEAGFKLSYSWVDRDKNIFEVKIFGLPEGLIDLDPVVTQQPPVFDIEAQKKTTGAPFPSVTYSCVTSGTNPRRIGHNTGGGTTQYFWRSGFDWNASGEGFTVIPLDATIDDVDVALHIDAETGTVNALIKRMQVSAWNKRYLGSCSQLWNYIDDDVTYASGSVVAGQWLELDLGSQAVSDCESHCKGSNGWFSVGVMDDSESEVNYASIDNFIKGGAFAGKLIIEYTENTPNASLFLVNDFEPLSVAEWLKVFWLLNDFDGLGVLSD